MPNLASINNTAVVIAPVKTSFHLIFASGNTLKIAPKIKAVTIRVMSVLIMYKNTTVICGKWAFSASLKPSIRVESVKDTNNRNARPIITENDKNLFFKKLSQLFLGFGFMPQI